MSSTQETKGKDPVVLMIWNETKSTPYIINFDSRPSAATYVYHQGVLLLEKKQPKVEKKHEWLPVYPNGELKTPFTPESFGTIDFSEGDFKEHERRLKDFLALSSKHLRFYIEEGPTHIGAGEEKDKLFSNKDLDDKSVISINSSDEEDDSDEDEDDSDEDEDDSDEDEDDSDEEEEDSDEEEDDSDGSQAEEEKKPAKQPYKRRRFLDDDENTRGPLLSKGAKKKVVDGFKNKLFSRLS